MLQVNARRKIYDVCIIGSGAGGGTAAKVLTEGGLDVVMLEAGPRLNPEKDYKEHVWPYELAHRGADVGAKGRLQMNNEFMAPNGAWEIDGEPYTTAPGSNFRWFRSRIEGGRTNHWGRIALRFGPADFRAHSTDGMGALHRNHHQEGLRSSQHHLHPITAGHSNQAFEWTRRLSLLCTVRAGLHQCFQFQLQSGDDSTGSSDGPLDNDCQRHGSRGCDRRKREG